MNRTRADATRTQAVLPVSTDVAGSAAKAGIEKRVSENVKITSAPAKRRAIPATADPINPSRRPAPQWEPGNRRIMADNEALLNI
jgi:hypothetical protein